MDYNAPDLANEFISYVEEQAKIHKETNILIPIGCDYSYENALQNFKKIEEMINFMKDVAVKENLSMKFKFSTPSEYLKSIRKEKNYYRKYTGSDFLPYADDSNEVYSGMFSSKPNLKKQAKDAGELQLLLNHHFSIQMLKADLTLQEVEDIQKARNSLEDATAILNEHNSITGGVREIVQLDNVIRMEKAVEFGLKLFKD